jgi:MATE family multidrug resistance protein
MSINNFKRLLRVMIPILVAQISVVGLNFINTAMSGHAGADDLAGVSVGASLCYPPLSACIGVLMAGTPMLAQIKGRRDKSNIPFVVRTGLALGLLIGIGFIIAYFLSIDSLMRVMALEPEVEHISRYYLLAMMGAVFFECLVIPLRALTDTIGETSISMRLFLLAMPINATLNYLLIFGNFGFPRLGGIGSGISSMLTYFILFLLFLTVVFRDHRFMGREIFSGFRTKARIWKEYLSLGLPNGMGIFMETSLFGIIIVFISKFGTTVLAAYQVASNFSNLAYMFPVSCSMALTIMVGTCVGAEQYKQARKYRTAGLAFSLSCSALTVIITVLLRNEVAMIYTSDAEVIQVAGHFLIYAAAWQLFDGIAVPIQGILRGYKDAQIPFLLQLVSYWLVCFPACLFLDKVVGNGAFSYWQGLDLGTIASALLITLRLIAIEKRYARKEAELREEEEREAQLSVSTNK